MPAAKRVSSHSEEDEEEEVPNKRLRKSQSISTNQANLAGYVEKVYMKNFMCHSALEVTLNRSINFVVGRNGSGKSAILAAVVIALGCKASSTNRASSLKDFVKSGAPSADVQVTLCNEGLHAYKPEVYGPKIIVVRKIYSGNAASSYKFKSAKGEVISTKREELDKIITAFNIQVDNPISILNQDTARTFLASSDPKSKYSIFMKATKLEDVDQLHSRTLNCEANVVNRLKLRREGVLSQENEIKELEKKANALRKLEEIRNRAVDLENEYCWALARDEENLSSELQCKIDTEKANVEPHQSTLEKLKEDHEKKLNSMRQTRSRLEGITEKLKETNQRRLKSNDEYKEINLSYRNSLQKYKQFAKEEKKYKLDMQTVRQAIERYKGGQEDAQERKRLSEAIQRCQVEQTKNIAVQQTVDLERQRLIAEFDAYREKESALRGERKTIEQAIVLKRSQLEKLKSQADNLPVYGDWMPRLVQRIEEYHRRGEFVRKPLGPLGTLFRVKDAQWARAIEIELGSVLRSFACHCGKDSQILQSLFREVVVGSKNPGILVSKFTDQLHNIRDTSVRVPGYSNIFEALHIPDVNVANFLIDNVNIEAILLIASGDDAAEMMSKNVPRNCKKSVTLKADQYFPYPDYRMYAANQRQRVCLLQVSRQEIIRELEAELETEQKNLLLIDGKLHDLKEKMCRNRERIQEVEKRVLDIRTSRLRLNAEINEYENAADAIPNPQHFLTLNSELENLQKKIEEVVQKCTEANQESDNLKAKCNEAADKIKSIQAELKEIEEMRQNLQVELASQKEIVKKADSRVKDFEALVAERKGKINKMIELLKEQEKQTEEALKHARDVCPERIRTQRSTHVIKRDVTDAKTYQDMVEKNSGVTTDVIDVLKEKKRKYQENIDQMTNIESGLKALSHSLNNRKGLYKIIRRIMALKVMYVFKPLLRTRGYKGDMVFDHEAKSLNVEIAPKQENGKRETKSLSGGERSYSTVSFILALWECVEPPFYFMDEFDVFMDKVNRRVVIEMLLMQARQKKKHQYVFFTPQDTSIVQASEDITIHKLDDPERMATALFQNNMVE